MLRELQTNAPSKSMRCGMLMAELGSFPAKTPNECEEPQRAVRYRREPSSVTGASEPCEECGEKKRGVYRSAMLVAPIAASVRARGGRVQAALAASRASEAWTRPSTPVPSRSGATVRAGSGVYSRQLDRQHSAEDCREQGFAFP